MKNSLIEKLEKFRRKIYDDVLPFISKLLKEFSKRCRIAASFISEHSIVTWGALPDMHRKTIIATSVVIVSLIIILTVLINSNDEFDLANSDGNTKSVTIDLAVPDDNDSLAFVDEYAEEELKVQVQAPVIEEVVFEQPNFVVSEPIYEDVLLSEKIDTSSQSQLDDWLTYRVQDGDTLAKIFRAQQLPLLDLYAVTAIEGVDKPLSRIKAGQLLKMKRASTGGLDRLEIEKSAEQEVVFLRLSDGNFIRHQ